MVFEKQKPKFLLKLKNEQHFKPKYCYKIVKKIRYILKQNNWHNSIKCKKFKTKNINHALKIRYILKQTNCIIQNINS